MPWDRRRARCFGKHNAAPRAHRRFCPRRGLAHAREASHKKSLSNGNRQSMGALGGMVQRRGDRFHHVWLTFWNALVGWFRSAWARFRNILARVFTGLRAFFLSARAWVLGVLFLVALVIAYYVLSDRYTPFTTDAYVQAYVIQVAPRVEGEIVRVHVVENQRVEKGDVLFEIDPRPFEHRVELLEAKLVEAIQQVAELAS